MEGADALVLMTEWNEFRALDLARVRQLLATPLVIDLRNIYRPAEMTAAGLSYVSIGRPNRPQPNQARAQNCGLSPNPKAFLEIAPGFAMIAEWLRRFDASDAPSAPVVQRSEVITSEHALTRELFANDI
jgi:crotonobetainyl-CoA:carnitine CoA-transferase CaiB-like acyl-CoA transferase